MAKIFGVLLIVLGVWVGMEIYTKGMDHAFGGALAGLADPIQSTGHMPSSAPADRETQVTTGTRGSIAQQVGQKVRGDIATGAARDGVESDGDSDADDNN